MDPRELVSACPCEQRNERGTEHGPESRSETNGQPKRSAPFHPVRVGGLLRVLVRKGPPKEIADVSVKTVESAPNPPHGKAKHPPDGRSSLLPHPPRAERRVSVHAPGSFFPLFSHPARQFWQSQFLPLPLRAGTQKTSSPHRPSNPNLETAQPLTLIDASRNENAHAGRAPLARTFRCLVRRRLCRKRARSYAYPGFALLLPTGS